MKPTKKFDQEKMLKIILMVSCGQSQKKKRCPRIIASLVVSRPLVLTADKRQSAHCGSGAAECSR